MGWANGTEVATKMIHVIDEQVKDPNTKMRLYNALIESLTDLDWDCTEEAQGIDPVFDLVLAEWEIDNS